MKALNFKILSILAALMCFAGPVMAEDGLAHDDAASPIQIGLHEPASPQMEHILSFHNDVLLWVISGITVFVMALLFWVIVRYNARMNPEPSRTTHHVMLEVIWTVVPVIILIIVAVPSFKTLFYLDRIPEPEMTLKVTGHQWYWSYEYPDYDGLAFDSNILADDEIDESKGQRRLLSTDNVVVLPVDTNIQIDITAPPTDVIHSFTVPALGFKKDAVPGRLNSIWVRISKPGVYYGQCSEICGRNHAFMPIEVHAVSKEEFAEWIEKAKKEFASNDYRPLPTRLAQLEGAQ